MGKDSGTRKKQLPLRLKKKKACLSSTLVQLVSWLVNSNYNLVYADCPNASSLPKYIDIDAKEIRLLGSQKNCRVWTHDLSAIRHPWQPLDHCHCPQKRKEMTRWRMWGGWGDRDRWWFSRRYAKMQILGCTNENVWVVLSSFTFQKHQFETFIRETFATILSLSVCACVRECVCVWEREREREREREKDGED